MIYVNLVLETSIGWIFSNMIAEAKQFRSKYPLFFCVAFFNYFTSIDGAVLSLGEKKCEH
jgi:hypothetical protein